MPATHVLYGPIPGQVLLFLLIAIGGGLFIRDAGRLYRLIMLGGPANRGDRIIDRSRSWIIHVLGQARLLTRSYSGVMHAFIFWGFLVITLSSIEQFGRGFWADFRIPLLSDSGLFLFAVDTFQLFVLVGIAMALYRRIAVKPWYLTLSGDAILILSLITTLMVTAFLAEGLLFVARPEVAQPWAYVGSALAGLFAPLGAEAALFGHRLFWWLHVSTLLGFLAYLPHSKHQHIVTAPINVYLRNLEPKGRLPYINIEEALEQDKPVGASQITHFSWKDLLDTMTCTECGRCTSQCPAALSGKELSPKDLILDLRHYLLDHGPNLLALVNQSDAARSEGLAKLSLPALVGDVIKDDVLWDCTTCRACVDACPVFIDHIPKIVTMRRHLAMEESRFGKDLQGLYEGLETTGNPWRFPRNQRAAWAADLGIPLLEDAPDAEVLYWVGCFGSFDERSKKIARAFAQLMQRAGVKFAILGPAETCSGDPARRTGNEYLYQLLATENVETLNAAQAAGIKTIVANCPHCFNTLSDEYPDFGGHYRVVHHTQLLNELVEQGKLKPVVARDEVISFHDPCYLGRYHGEYDAPRSVINSIPSLKLREIQPSREKAMCCGAGGGHAFLQDTRGQRINNVRLEQAMAGNPERIATACPFCMMMFEDATGTKGVADTLPVQDIAELLEEATR